jgi:hypothetical protein
MASFKTILDKKIESHAYCQGAEACTQGKPLRDSPYERGSKADAEWVDGYLDVMFLKRITSYG